MELGEARAFVSANHRGVLATRRRDGTAVLAPVVAGLGADGRVAISTRGGSHKVANLRRHPRASLCVFTDGFFGAFVQIDGPVEILELPGCMDGLVELYRQIAGEHPDWEDFRAAMRREGRVLVMITPERVGPARQP